MKNFTLEDKLRLSYNREDQSKNDFLEDKDYISLVVSMNTLVDIDKKTILLDNPSLQNFFLCFNFEILLDSAKDIEEIYKNGVDLDCSDLLNLVDEFQTHTKPFTKAFGLGGIDWIMKEIPLSTMVCYARSIAEFGEFLATTEPALFPSIDVEAAHAIRFIEIDKDDQIKALVTDQLFKKRDK